MIIPFTLCEVPAPVRVSSSRSMFLNDRVVGIHGIMLLGKGISSLSEAAIF